MAQLVKVPATKPNDPRLVPRTHMMEGENKLPQVALCLLTSLPRCKIKKINVIKNYLLSCEERCGP